MSEIITAVYENGVLRPLNPVNLPEGQKVRLRVLPAVPETASEIERALQPLIDAGRLTPPPRRGDVEPVSEEQLRELTESLKAFPGKPLSEIIIEERGSL